MTISITTGDTPNFAAMDRMQLEKIAQQAATLCRRLSDGLTYGQRDVCFTQWMTLVDTLNTEPLPPGGNS